MKKAILRKLRAMSESVLGKEETDKIIKETVDKTVNELLEETKPRPKKKKSDK